MMFQVSEVIDAVKSLASADPESGRSHCQALEFYAKQLGYTSFHHLKRSLQRLPSDRFGKVSLRLVRQITARRVPTLACSYYQFLAFEDGRYGFFSHWIGWDRHGDEVRVPSPFSKGCYEHLRKIADFPVYVVESEKELLAWRYNWLSAALIPERLAKQYFPFAFNKRLRVEKNPPLHKIKSGMRYASNIVRE